MCEGEGIWPKHSPTGDWRTKWLILFSRHFKYLFSLCWRGERLAKIPRPEYDVAYAGKWCLNIGRLSLGPSPCQDSNCKVCKTSAGRWRWRRRRRWDRTHRALAGVGAEDWGRANWTGEPRRLTSLDLLKRIIITNSKGRRYSLGGALTHTRATLPIGKNELRLGLHEYTGMSRY